MADNNAPQGAPEPEAPEKNQEPQETDWKAEARKWESRAKENSQAAARLAEIEDANKTEVQRATEAQEAAERRAADAEARALRRDVALEHSLTKDDAALLDAINDEDAMRALATRLAANSGHRPGNPAPLEGGTPKHSPVDEERRAFARGLVEGSVH